MIVREESYYDREQYIFELLMNDMEYNDIKVYLPLAKCHTQYNHWNKSITYHMSKKEVEKFPAFYERMRNAFGMNDSKDKQRKLMIHFRNNRGRYVFLDYQVYDDVFGKLAQKCENYILTHKEVCKND